MMSKTKSTITQRPSVGASLPSFELVIKGLAPDKDVAFYNYDNRNQLNHVAEGTNISSYSYNTDGLRIEKKVNGVVTKYLYESDKVVAEADASNLIIARNYNGTNLLARQVENDVLFYMYNAHGDVTTLINGVGTVVATYDYDAFGTVIEKTGNANNSITYAGYQFDEESDLYYLNARYYDSKIARFMSEDTYRGQKNDPLSLNLYSYVSNNPIRYFDPTGHMQKGDDYYSADVQKQLVEYTQKYYDAKDDDTRRIIAIQAKNLRASSELQIKSHGIPITNAFLDALEQSKYSDYDGKKYLISDDWRRINNSSSDSSNGNGSNSKEDKFEDIANPSKSTTDVIDSDYLFENPPDAGIRNAEIERDADSLTYVFLLAEFINSGDIYKSYLYSHFKGVYVDRVTGFFAITQFGLNIASIKSVTDIDIAIMSEYSDEIKQISTVLDLISRNPVAYASVILDVIEEDFDNTTILNDMKFESTYRKNAFNLFVLENDSKKFISDRNNIMDRAFACVEDILGRRPSTTEDKYLMMKVYEKIDYVIDLNRNSKKLIKDWKKDYQDIEQGYYKAKYGDPNEFSNFDGRF